ncbi:site-specific integrase [Bifidobacterium myosotis]|uniref:Site-specific integrase n=2 Tax=Bifidobacterium myosotis TaxID=1630166 RepID=A0A5M9ZKI0_9BIFI|nr:site-specific integrase [Bifidobacterium myosotis]
MTGGKTAKRATRRAKGSDGATMTADGRWRATVSLSPDPADGSRRRVTAVGATRAQALKRARDKALEIERGGIDPRGMPTVGEWLDRWVDGIVALRRAPNTTRSYRTRIGTDIRPVIGAVPLDRLRPSHIRAVENRIVLGDAKHGLKPRSGATAAVTHSILKTALDAAVAEGLIRTNPALAAEPPRTAPARIDTLTPGQAAAVIRAETDPAWRIMWRLLFVLGLREGEAMGVTARELVRSDGLDCLLVEWQLKEFDRDTVMPPGFEAIRLDGRAWLTRPKTRAGRRLIPLPADLARDMRAYAAAHPVPDGTPMFRSRRGNPLRRQSLHDAWHRALDRAGMPRVRVHSARHTAATALARLGVSDLAREAIMGHADIGVTNTVYTHVDAGMLAGAIDGIDRLIDAGGATHTVAHERP